jgi:hypothetical protein
MENRGYIEIHIEGLKGQMPLSPGNYDISELRGLLDRAEQLLFPAIERKNRPVVSYEIKDGSVRHIFKTSLQAIIGFNAALGQVADKRTIDFLEYPTAKAFYALQETARKQNYSFEISTSIPGTTRLHIDPTTDYSLPDYDEHYLNSLIGKAKESWADVEDTDAWVRELREGCCKTAL